MMASLRVWASGTSGSAAVLRLLRARHRGRQGRGRKTTVTAAMAIAAARLGQRVLVVEMEGASGLGPSLGSDHALGSSRSSCAPRASEAARA